MFWKLKAAFSAFLHRLRYPVIRAEGHSWDGDEHTHICYAVRILNTRDFRKVCPMKNLSAPELDDECDCCRYFGDVTFGTTRFNRNFVQFNLDQKGENIDVRK